METGNRNRNGSRIVVWVFVRDIEEQREFLLLFF